jgi:hypothetical protein
MGASTPAELEKSAEAVAFLALAYHELSTRWSSVGPRLDGVELYDDLEAGDPELSLVITVASDTLAELDWRVVRWLGGPVAVEFGADRGFGPEEFELRGAFEPWRLEAALHAVAAGGKEERLHPPTSLPATSASRSRARISRTPTSLPSRISEGARLALTYGTASSIEGVPQRYSASPRQDRLSLRLRGRPTAVRRGS